MQTPLGQAQTKSINKHHFKHEVVTFSSINGNWTYCNKFSRTSLQWVPQSGNSRREHLWRIKHAKPKQQSINTMFKAPHLTVPCRKRISSFIPLILLQEPWRGWISSSVIHITYIHPDSAQLFPRWSIFTEALTSSRCCLITALQIWPASPHRSSSASILSFFPIKCRPGGKAWLLSCS